MRSARISTGPSGVSALTPATVSPDQIRSVASAFIMTFSDGKPFAVLAQEIEKIPLRHEGDEGVFYLEPAEVGDADRGAAELAVHLLQSLVRKFQKSVDQAEFIHHLQRRGMHGVAAEIAEEIGVLFQHDRFDSGAPEQIAQHHAGRPAADDAAAGVEGALRGRLFRRGNRIHGRLLLNVSADRKLRDVFRPRQCKAAAAIALCLRARSLRRSEGGPRRFGAPSAKGGEGRGGRAGCGGTERRIGGIDARTLAFSALPRP